MRKITILCFFGMFCSSVFSQDGTVKDNSIPGLWKSSIEMTEKGKSIMKNENIDCISEEYLKSHSYIDLHALLDKKKLICQKLVLENNENNSRIILVCNPSEENKDSEAAEVKISYQSDKEYNEINTDYIGKENSEILINIKIKSQRTGSCK